LDAQRAISDRSTLAPKLPSYGQLLTRLYAAANYLPTRYQSAVLMPCLALIQQLGPQGYPYALRDSGYAPLWESALAILHADGSFETSATQAAQELVSDLYEGFLSEEDRANIKPPDRSLLTPLVKWGASSRGPYTYPLDSVTPLGLQAAIVNLPVCNSRAGLISWPSLSHETAGHDILTADQGLLAELRELLRTELPRRGFADYASYFAERLDEMVADVVGVLNLGPTAVLGFIGHFRALRSLALGSPQLSTREGSSGRYPPDVLRGFLQAHVVSLLQFDQAAQWSDILRQEIASDLNAPLLVRGQAVEPDRARAATCAVAELISGAPLQSLFGHAISEIQNWRNGDEQIAAELRAVLLGGQPLPSSYAEGTYAAHALAAAVTGAVQSGENSLRLLGRLRTMLCDMHRQNPLWSVSTSAADPQRFDSRYP
jgi:hypothetical protein